MSRLLLFIPTLLSLLAFGCTSVSSSSGSADDPRSGRESSEEQGPAKKFTEGKDYLVLERLRVIDPNGFGEPTEAYSILVPKGWKSTGGITWQVGNPCMTEVIKNRVSVTSPDGKMALELYPSQQWEWWDDQLMLQTQVQQQQNPVFKRCPIAQPLDAAQFLKGPMAQEIGAQVVGVEPNEEVGALLREQTAAANKQFQAAGVNVENRPSAALATLRYPDGSGGIALCSVGMTVALMPNYMTGGQSASYTCSTQQKIAVRCPAGQEAEAKKLLSTVLASFRMNPKWLAGVQQMVSNVAAVERTETMKRAEIQRDAMNYSADLQQRTWESGQESRDRISEGWSQTLRGVDSWRDAGGANVELSAGYDQAWSKPDGTYILSNNPLFDPNVAFQEDWRKLEKGR